MILNHDKIKTNYIINHAASQFLYLPRNRHFLLCWVYYAIQVLFKFSVCQFGHISFFYGLASYWWTISSSYTSLVSTWHFILVGFETWVSLVTQDWWHQPYFQWLRIWSYTLICKHGIVKPSLFFLNYKLFLLNVLSIYWPKQRILFA